MRAEIIESALRANYKQPEWALFFEVSDGTGSAARRRADAIAMNMWPSRGLELRAFEIKVSRSDMKSELNDPSKAEAVAQFCDSFYLATPPKLTEGMDVPDTWGLIEVSESGSLKVIRKSTMTHKPAPLQKTFIASLLRSSAKIGESEIRKAVDAALRKAGTDEQERVKAKVQDRVRQLESQLSQEAEFFDALEEALGDKKRRIVEDKNFLAAVRAVHQIGVHDTWLGVRALSKQVNSTANSIRACSERIDNALSLLSPETSEEPRP